MSESRAAISITRALSPTLLAGSIARRPMLAEASALGSGSVSALRDICLSPAHHCWSGAHLPSTGVSKAVVAGPVDIDFFSLWSGELFARRVPHYSEHAEGKRAPNPPPGGGTAAPGPRPVSGTKNEGRRPCGTAARTRDRSACPRMRRLSCSDTGSPSDSSLPAQAKWKCNGLALMKW